MASNLVWQKQRSHAGENRLEADLFGGAGHWEDKPGFDNPDGKDPEWLSPQGSDIKMSTFKADDVIACVDLQLPLSCMII